MLLVLCKKTKLGSTLIWESNIANSHLTIRYGYSGKKPRTQIIPVTYCGEVSLEEFQRELAMELVDSGYAQIDESPYSFDASFESDDDSEGAEVVNSQDWF